MSATRSTGQAVRRRGPRRKPPPPSRPGLKLKLQARLGILGDLHLVPYRSHGTPRFLHVKGRLIEAAGLAGSPGENRTWHNIMNTVRRLESDEIPGARIECRWRGERHEIYTDDEGFFQLFLYSDAPLEGGWHTVELELLESVKRDARARAEAEVFVPPADAEFAVVSDMDDTVIRTGATSLATELKTVFPKDAHTRTPFDGAAPFYRALARGADDRGSNPVYYVSKSGWNLYDLFIEFFDHHDLPRGAMFLQDLAVREGKSPALGSEFHKLDRIRALLKDQPDLRFILIGDSGQHDPETYRRIVHEHPGRVAAIYIRDVAESKRDREVEAIARDMRERGVLVHHAEDTSSAAQHAAAHGFISSSGLEEVRRAG